MKEQLVELARKARQNAYAPYSQFKVGAAVEGGDGRVFTGCNVENASFGATICAERAAIVKMVSEGVGKFKGLAVCTEYGNVPCGLCLQVLVEFASNPEVEIHLCKPSTGEVETLKLNELLPRSFCLKF